MRTNFRIGCFFTFKLRKKYNLGEANITVIVYRGYTMTTGLTFVIICGIISPTLMPTEDNRGYSGYIYNM